MDHDSTQNLRGELTRRFGGILEGDLLEESVQICTNNQFSAEDFRYKWEAVNYNRVPQIVDAGSISQVKQAIEKDVKTKKAQARLNFSGLLTKHLGRAPKRSTPKQDIPGGVQFTRSEAAETKYRYMYEKVSERSEALNDRIDEFSGLVQEYYNVSELGDPAASTEDEVTIVGRITIDVESGFKLDESSMTLESSRAMGSGARIPLRFDSNVRVRGGQVGRGGMGFFPGAVVALRGKNGGGGWFHVSEVLTLPLPSQGPPPTAGAPFSACIACGPFTSDGDLKYGPWTTALQKISELKPDVVILVGPFVDSDHACVKNGEINDSLETLFDTVFIEPLNDLLDKRPGTSALLVPSVKDILSNHAVFPQSQFDHQITGETRIRLLPNPCTFALNGVLFGAESVDVLFHLRKEEYFKHMSEIQPISGKVLGADSMASLCRHILEQRSFYPIFPVPLDLSHDINLDVTHDGALRLCSASTSAICPSVLILPSRLKQFCKIINGTTFVNPSSVSKNSFAFLTFSGHETKTDSVVVEIVKTV